MSKTRSKLRVVKLTAKQYDLLVTIVETRALLLTDLDLRGQKVAPELKSVDDLLTTLDEYQLS